MIIRRREFIAVFGGTAVSWPFGATAQQSSMPVIGFLNGGSHASNAQHVVAFRQGLAEAGYIEAKTWLSNTAGQKANLAVCPRSQAIW
jgi:putative ABC transport system substrate-binding protein